MSLSNMSVGVVIPTTGHRVEELFRAIDSVLSQTIKPEKVVIVWDGEVNDSVVSRLLAKNLQVEFTPKPRSGVSVARQIGVLACKTEFIAFLDDDDYWILNKLENQMECIISSGEPLNIFSFGQSMYRYENGNVKSLVPKQTYVGYDSIAAYLFSSIPFRGSVRSISFSTVLVSRNLIIQFPFNSSMRSGEDIDFILRISKVSKIVYLHRELAITTFHERTNGGLSYFVQNPSEWLKWNFGLSQMIGKRLSANMRVAYGSRMLVRQEHYRYAFSLIVRETFRGDADLKSITTGLLFILRGILKSD